jgi:hypothetical protein
MSEEKEVRVEGLTEDNSNLLLAAAVELGQEIGVVKTSSHGYFIVPESVAKQAGLEPMVEYQGDEETKPAAKKAAAKKTASPKE